jgi:hypothetical protein
MSGMIMTGESVRAILDGRKTQTRRVVTPHNSEFGAWGAMFWKHADFTKAFVDGKGSGSEYLHVPRHAACSDECQQLDGVWDRLRPRMAPARCWDQTADPSDGYVPPASRLWVRESFAGPDHIGDGDQGVRGFGMEYKADGAFLAHGDCGCEGRCSGVLIAHPWKPSIHMPRWASRITLEITVVRVERVQDISEADAYAEGVDPDWTGSQGNCPYTAAFANLWHGLNAKRGYGWDANPWVWVLTFKRVTP